MNKIWMLLTVAVAAVTWSADADACSCAQLPIANEFHSAAAVFKGRVVQVTEHDPQAGAFHMVRVQVQESYKGDLPYYVTLSTSASEGSCGISFLVSREYLFWPSGELSCGGLWASSCSRTASYWDSRESVEWLRHNVGSPMPPIDDYDGGCGPDESAAETLTSAS